MVRVAKIMVVLGLLVLCGSAWAVEPNLVSHWKFDEGSGTIAYDSAGDNDGTIYGAQWTTGQVGGALDFDGSGDYVLVLDDDSLTPSSELTISSWVYINSISWSDRTAIVNKYDYVGGDRSYFLQLGKNEDPDNNSVCLQVSSATRPFRGKVEVCGTTQLQADQWYHVVVTHEADHEEVWINGVEEIDDTDPSIADSIANNNDPLYIGYHKDENTYFNGTIDDVRIYNRALSAEEIEELYRGQLLSLEIVGPAEVAENSQVSYKAIAHYDIGSPKDVTNSADWSVEPNAIASIDGNGLLATEEIYILEEDITIYAQYTEDTNTFEAEKAVSVFAICPIGKALSFDGVNDYVDVGDPPDGSLDFGTADFTLSVWFKTSMSAPGLFVCKRAKGYYAGYDFYIERDGKIFARIADGWSVPDARTTEGFNDGLWHHAAAVYDRDGVIRIYVDSVIKATSGSIEWIGNVDNSEPFTIGDRNDPGHHYYFDGTIDDVRIYDRALSPEEIQANMHILLSGDEPNLVGYWGFDEGEGQVAYDLSGNSNNGYLGSDPCDVDSADPAWVESDAPIGICTTGGLIERNITRALESKQRALEEIEAALANENATIGVLEALFRSRDYGNLDKNDIVKAKQEIHSAVQNEQRSTDTLEKSIEKLEDSLSVLGYEVEPNGNNN